MIGNPPWEVLRGERGGNHDSAAPDGIHAKLRRVRVAGEWTCQPLSAVPGARGYATRRGGRLALVLPSGFAIDHGCADLRRALLDSNTIDTFVSIENRDGAISDPPRVEFLLMTATRGGGRRPAHAVGRAIARSAG